VRLAPLALLLPALGCSQQTIKVQLHPLQANGDVTFVCRNAAGEGVPLSNCNPGAIDRDELNLFALVTQTLTGEVAVLNVPMDPRNPIHDPIVDVDWTAPGYQFLPVGAQPGAIVTTPGGQASFVGVAEAGKPGIFALPSGCLSAPQGDEPARDLTTWPACSLPSAPGEMVVAIDRPDDNGQVFASCDHSLPAPATSSSGSLLQCGTATGLDLANEGGPPGRRKLIVALPDQGSLAIIDAQRLLDQPPGAFPACPIEATVPLRVELPPTKPTERLPADLQSCDASTPPAPEPPPSFSARPAGVALGGDTLYVADGSAPVIHVLDASSPCSLAEKPPLLPVSLEDPSRVVTTSRIAVSPLTPSGKRFVYAIDEFDPSKGSVIAFDVSPGSSERTPLVRPHAALIPTESPDRIQFDSAPKDLTFLLRDRPEVDPTTGNIEVGRACNPDPNASASDVGTLYRASSDYTSGARPTELRGVFSAVLLSSGRVAVVDVEDFDAPCRRPISANSSSKEDFRGCASDPTTGASVYVLPNTTTPTVTNEVTCNTVEPHRARAANVIANSAAVGVRAPSLRGFPQLQIPDTAGQVAQGERPHVLAVDFGPSEGEEARVFVGSTEYVKGATASATTSELVIDPSRALYDSIALPFNEPRAYPPSDSFSLSYEGPVTGSFASGFFKPSADGSELLLNDPVVGFCDRGVNDVELMRSLGQERFGLSGDALESFAAAHTDYVVINADFPADDDVYWQNLPAECGSATRDTCERTFGAFDTPNDPAYRLRDFRIRDAQQGLLVLEPRAGSPEGTNLNQLAACCFPSGTSYYVRASQQWVLRGSDAGVGFRHDIVAQRQGDVLNCVRDCNPRKRYFNSRVFEIADSTNAQPGDVCVSSQPGAAVSLNEPAAACIYDSPIARFAVYRGRQSFRDMVFTWQTIGGFSTLRFELGGLSSTVSPQTIVALPDIDWLSVVDASSLGLAFMSLNSLTVLTPTLN
jgi:hypothetical protein